MAAVLLSNGAKGKRLCLPNSMVLIHQPSGGRCGKPAERVARTRDTVNERADRDERRARFSV